MVRQSTLKQEQAGIDSVDPDDFLGHSHTVSTFPPASSPSSSQPRIHNAPLIDQVPVQIEKSNVLMLGPSGVGKTLIAKTLARVLEVPYSMSDCTPFTQAGYIGEDVEMCVQRLLAAANYDVAQAERGIIVLDELDKIATARVSHGKDVGGEGVQQALLKILEGTTVQVQAKAERGSSSASSRGASMPSPSSPPTSSLFSSMPSPPPSKTETYNINTDNILFICSGAFVGLHKLILDRIAKGSMGFGVRVRSASLSPSSSSSSSSTNPSNINDPTIEASLPENDTLFRQHLPFFAPTDHPNSSADPPRHNLLDLVTPEDLHKYGLIPELTGRLPITTALAPLTIQQLIRVLTEPRNALLDQYVATFSHSSIELRFTTGALHAVARAAAAMGTGARGLRTVMERTLGDAQFEAPGSGVRHVLVTEAAVEGKERVGMWGREGRGVFHGRLAMEEEEWLKRSGGDGSGGEREGEGESERGDEGGFGSFEQYRERAKVAGSG